MVQVVEIVADIEMTATLRRQFNLFDLGYFIGKGAVHTVATTYGFYVLYVYQRYMLL